jgi:hypothetical protein
LEDTVTQALKAFNNIYDVLNGIRKILSKKGEWTLFGSKKKEIVERKFREALDGTKNVVESCIWYGKGFAITANCGVKVDESFHELMGLSLMKFNDINMRLDSDKLDEKLVENLQSQLKILSDYAQHFWNISGSTNHPDKEAEAMKIIDDFRSRLWDFTKIMESYLKAEEPKSVFR